MATAESVIVHKHFRLDKNKLKRAKALFDVSTETEAVNRALDLAIEEHERNRIVAKAHREFVESGIEIQDVFGSLAE
jgi:predicted regulator of amino acid metabolism with ACT domain